MYDNYVIKLLLILAIPALLIGGGYFYLNYQSSNKNLENPTEGSRTIDGPVEVPKTLPESKTTSDNKQVLLSGNKTPTPSVVVLTTSSIDSKIAVLETVVKDRKSTRLNSSH